MDIRFRAVPRSQLNCSFCARPPRAPLSPVQKSPLAVSFPAARLLARANEAVHVKGYSISYVRRPFRIVLKYSTRDSRLFTNGLRSDFARTLNSVFHRPATIITLRDVSFFLFSKCAIRRTSRGHLRAMSRGKLSHKWMLERPNLRDDSFGHIARY